MLGDVGHPQLVWCWPVEAALDQVGGGRDVRLVADQLPGSWQPMQAVEPHDLADGLAVDDHAVAVDQLGIDPPPAVGAPGVGVNSPHQIGQPGKPELTWRGRASAPHEEPGGGHAEDAAALLDREASPGQLSDDRVFGFWAHPLLEQLRGLLDQGEFGLQLLDALSGRRQLPLFAGRGARLEPAVDEVLGLPPVHRRLGQPQLGGDHPHRPTGPHQFHHPPAELRIVGSWHASSSALGRASLT
jgi:hypothetical protein